MNNDNFLTLGALLAILTTAFAWVDLGLGSVVTLFGIATVVFLSFALKR